MILNSKKISFIILGGINKEEVDIVIGKNNSINSCKVDSLIFKKFLNNDIIFNGEELEIHENIKKIKNLKQESNTVVIYCDGSSTLLESLFLILKIAEPSHIFIDCLFSAEITEHEVKHQIFGFNNQAGWGFWEIFNAQSKIKLETDEEKKKYRTQKVYTILNATESFNYYLKLDDKSILHSVLNLYSEATNNDKFYVKIILYLSVLEMLNNNGAKDSITLKVSRLPAVLLGFDLETSKAIFRNMTKIYGIRSDMVHAAKFEKANEEITVYLSNIISSIFLTLLCLDKLKIEEGETYETALFNELNSYGFGQRNNLLKNLSTTNKIFLAHKKEFFLKNLFPKKEQTKSRKIIKAK
jgi:hypothetical protein